MYRDIVCEPSVSSATGRSGGVHLSKRRLGVTYITGTGAVMGGLLVGLLANGGLPAGVVFFGLVSVCALLALTYWFRRLDLDSDQVWHAAECGALAMGLVTLLLVGARFTSRLASAPPTLAVGLVAVVATSTSGGVLVGVAHELHRSRRQLSVRNDVLQRVLQHYLRNDMMVVLSRLDEVKSRTDDPERRKLETAERKIDTLLALTDTVSRVNGSREQRSLATVDVAPLVRQRVTHLREVHPDVELATDLPETARVETDERVGLVVDNVVESAVRYSTDRPVLRIAGFVDGDEFVLRVEDEGETIPAADLSELTTDGHERFNCGRGVELWLVRWLTERSGGRVTVETDASPRRIDLRFDRSESLDSWL
jgi:signal transduction histidine kinase